MSWFSSLFSVFKKKPEEPKKDLQAVAASSGGIMPTFEMPLNTQVDPAAPAVVKEEVKEEVKPSEPPPSPVAAKPAPEAPKPEPKPVIEKAVAPEPPLKKEPLLTTANVNFRKAPSGVIIRELVKATRVVSIGEPANGWQKVEIGTEVGYVSISYLAKSVTVDLTEELIKEARKWIGVTEKGGNNKGPEVERFQKAVDGKSMSEAWCMAFMQFCLKEVAERFKIQPGIYTSEHCLTVWNKSMASLRLKKPEPGAIVIWNVEGTTNGHTGVVTDVVDAKTFKTIEGNTGPEVAGELNREGDGVYAKTRSIDGVGKMKVKGFLQPYNKMNVTVFA